MKLLTTILTALVTFFENLRAAVVDPEEPRVSFYQRHGINPVQVMVNACEAAGVDIARIVSSKSENQGEADTVVLDMKDGNEPGRETITFCDDKESLELNAGKPFFEVKVSAEKDRIQLDGATKKLKKVLIEWKEAKVMADLWAKNVGVDLRKG